jgi:hypothetical protein
MDSCEDPAAASLAQQDLCLNHFLYCCYEHLDRVDPRRYGSGLGSVNLDLTKTFVEECSRKALDVSLQYSNITNLQRGRLLDILLGLESFSFYCAHRREVSAAAVSRKTVYRTKRLGART